MSAPLRAPQADGAILAVPGFDQVDSLVSQNRRTLSEVRCELLDRPLSELRALARRETLEAARNYLADGGEQSPGVVADSLILAGHQPELFHPGVWIKNFALNKIARRTGATPLTLIVDNDTVKSTTLRFPSKPTGGGPWESWRRVQLPFDFHGPDIPYEERTVADETIFESFPRRASQITDDWPFTTLLGEFWPTVLAQRGRTPLLGERLASARRVLERRWCCHNLEVPVSRLCATEAFSWFVTHLLSQLGAFHSAHNEIVREYRRRHRIRSRNHPVPDLAEENGWLEAPFWIWRRGDQRRGRLFVRGTGQAIQVRTATEVLSSSEMSELLERGFKVRPRALTTTLFARLMLADLFIHGIGGAKYDALTDELLRGFYGIEPPAFMTLSATLLLPFDVPPVDPSDCIELEQQLRDLWFNPQRHLPLTADSTALAFAAEKEQWIVRAGQGRQRHEKLGELSARLRPFTAAAREQIEQETHRCREQLESQEVLFRRDYAFCLFPEEKLRRFCQQFL